MVQMLCFVPPVSAYLLTSKPHLKPRQAGLLFRVQERYRKAASLN